MFGGFKAISANFTPAPNQFFDEVLGHYPCRVVTVVGILIRSTLGWEDPDTGDRRIEAELPLSSFIRPDLCESSARKGLAEAMGAGLIVRTAAASSRDGARYALRWADGAALERALAKSRRMHGTESPVRPATENRGLKNTPLDESGRGVHFGGLKNTPPYIDKTKSLIPGKKRKTEQTLNVREGVNFVDLEETPPPTVRNQTRQNLFDAGLAGEAGKIVEELRDWGSERRHRQLVSICEQHGLFHLCTEALQATRQRLAKEQKHGVLEKPGAYYQRVLVQLLERRQIFVPTSGEDDPTEVARLARISLGLEFEQISQP